MNPLPSSPWQVYVCLTWFVTPPSPLCPPPLESCLVFRCLRDIVIDFALSTSIKCVAHWRHTGQGGGVRVLKGKLHYVSPTQCARASMISYLCKLLYTHICVIASWDIMDHTVNFTVGSCCCCRSTEEGWGQQKAKQERTTACRCIHVPLGMV